MTHSPVVKSCGNDVMRDWPFAFRIFSCCSSSSSSSKMEEKNKFEDDDEDSEKRKHLLRIKRDNSLCQLSVNSVIRYFS